MLTREGKTQAEIFPTVCNMRKTLERRFPEISTVEIVGKDGIGRYPNSRGCSNTSIRVEPRNSYFELSSLAIYLQGTRAFLFF